MTAADASAAGPAAVTVAVLTYRRPGDLAAVVPMLLDQAAASAEPVRVLVVDNDPARSGEPTLEPYRGRVAYRHEPVPGIAAARNAALDACRAGDVLVFIDDDERPTPGWLAALLTTYRATGAAAVVGPVVSRFDGDVDPWVLAGDFFRRRRLATGDRVQVAATNNLLLDVARVRALGLRFDERFGLTGGSDHLFTRQLSGAGAAIVWCAEALVVDVVPTERLTRRWVLRRALRSGNSTGLVGVDLAATRVQRARVRSALAGSGAVRVVGGCARVVLGLATRSPAHQARGARTCARGLGLLAGAAGRSVVEYGRATAAAPAGTRAGVSAG